MNRPTIPSVPTPVPTRNDPENFAARADATLGALPSVVDGMNAMGLYMGQRGGDADASAIAAAQSEAKAWDSAAASELSRRAAALSAAAAAASPAMPSTTAASLSVSPGMKTFLTQPARLWAEGQHVRIARTAAPAEIGMGGVVITYDAATGHMSVVVGQGMTQGQGEHAGWTITGSGPTATLAQLGLPLASSGPNRIMVADAAGRVYELRTSEEVFAPARSAFGVPVGMVAHFATTRTPSAWLRLNGTLASRVAYADLFNFAKEQGLVGESEWFGGAFGRFSLGNGSTTFRVPDLRGLALRGLDDGRGFDPDRAWGTHQDSDNRSHAHAVADPTHAHPVADPTHTHPAWTDAQGWHDHANGLNGNNGLHGLQFGSGAHTGNIGLFGVDGGRRTDGNGQHGHNVGVGAAGTGIGIHASATGIAIHASGGAESRPRNIAYPLFIKY
ncbi:phage tail protein [Variovorax sp. J22P168]|uniref:phage tail protein n=1 Tax=Variovorax jilinensis TaxID=3053513 RepID=UPI002577DBFC|nr:phage tail protein [Variovorax sp. J22P168]MDM0011991.1 phage tail protein [Variovorax sp. J22P168]